jgi:hypothetical protein
VSWIAPTLIALLLSAALVYLHWRWRVAVQAEYIRRFVLPPGLFDKLRQKRPQLSLKDCQLVSHALRQFFLAYLKSGREFVSMPSQVADDLWHEFILYTRHYEAFCKRAFGGFLHHSPAAVLGSNRRSNAGLRRVWWHACREENINPRNATRLPLIFALDAKLDIADGFRYSVQCQNARVSREGQTADGTVIYCGGDFSSSSFDGSTDGFGDSGGGDGWFGDSSSGDGHSGCNGDGCGGGGCGGD